MRLEWMLRKRRKGDNRITILRGLYGDQTRRGSWKFSISLHPRLFHWEAYYEEFRLTIMGVNIHYVERTW